MSPKKTRNAFLTLRTIFLTPEINRRLNAECKRRQADYSLLVRGYLLAGIRAVEKTGNELDISTPLPQGDEKIENSGPAPVILRDAISLHAYAMQVARADAAERSVARLKRIVSRLKRRRSKK